MRNVRPLTKCFILSCIPTAVLPAKQDPRAGEGETEWKKQTRTIWVMEPVEQKREEETARDEQALVTVSGRFLSTPTAAC